MLLNETYPKRGTGFNLDMLGNSLRCAIEHLIEVIICLGILHFDEDKFALLVFQKDIHTIELVVLRFLVAVAFEDMLYFHILAEQP